MRKIFSLFTAILFAGSMMAAVVSGTAYQVKGNTFPEGWSGSNTWSASSTTSYLLLHNAANYLQTDEFCQNGFTSIVVNARKYGGPSNAQLVISVEWVANGADPVLLGTISPSSTSLANYTISNPADVTGNTTGYIKFSCKDASSNKGSGIQVVTINYTAGTCVAADPHTVSFSTGEGNPTVEAITETEGGAGITLPAGPAPTCTNWAFAGWATAAVAAETTTAPTLLAAGATYKPAEDVTLYAVYKRVEGAVFDATEGGEFYIYAEIDGVKHYATAFAEKLASTTDVESAVLFTFEKIVEEETTYFAIKSGEAYLSYGTSGTNFTFTGTTPYKWEPTTGTYGTWRMLATSTTGRALTYRAGSTNVFGPYATSNINGSEYYDIEIGAGTTYYISAPTCEPVVEPTTKTIYCKVTQAWWKEDNAAVGIYAFKGEAKNAEFPGVRMEAVEGEADLWKADIDTAVYSSIIFTRVNASGDIADYGAKTGDLAIPADKDLYTITSTAAVWGDPGVEGEWSVYGEEPVVVEHTYTVAGSSAILGVNWDPAAAANDMTFNEESELYELEIAEVELNAGNYEYKVAIDHAWENGEAVNNSTIEIAKSGKYKVTFTYNAGLAVTEAVATLLEEVEIDPTAELGIGIWGNDADWAQTNMVLAADKASASYTVAIEEAGDYRFKLVINSNWRSNGYEYHRGYTGAAGINSNAADMKLTADVAGDYIFTWFFENDSIAITFPAAPVYTLENGYYLVGDKYDWTPAAERLFVANGEGGEYVLAGVTLEAEDSLKVVYVENDAIKTYYPGGTDNNYVVDAAHAGVKDIYFRPDGQGGDDWYYRCIYVAPTSGTAIDKVAGEAKAVKILKNGMLIIEKNGVKYNVLGVRL